MTTLLPYRYESFSWTFAWDTNILKARNGLEQRIARLTSPRETFAMEYSLDADQAADLRRILVFTPTGFYLPLRHDGLPATAAITGTAVHADTTLSDWPATGVQVLVENGRGDYYDATVNVLTSYPGSSTFTLSASPPGGTTFGVGSTITPLALIDIADLSSLSNYRVNAGSWKPTGKPRSFTTTWGTGATVNQYDGMPVLDRHPRGAGQAEEQADAGLRVIDYGAAIVTATARDQSDVVRFHSYQMGGGRGSFAYDRQWWRSFLYGVRGRQGLFLLPTWRDDVVLHTVPLTGTDTLVVESSSAYATWFASAAQRRLQITTDLRGGDWTWVTVDHVVDNGDGTQTITLTGPDVPADPIESISFLETCRLEDDAITVNFGPGVGLLDIHARAVQQ